MCCISFLRPLNFDRFCLFSSGRYLISGDHYGDVIVWDTNAQCKIESNAVDAKMKHIHRFKAHHDTVNGAR